MVSPAIGAFLALTGARVPVIQAPMAGFGDHRLAIASIEAGGVGSLACALLDATTVIAEVTAIRAAVRGPLNLNFFCHTLGPQPDDDAWRQALAPFYAVEGVDPPPAGASAVRRPFDAAMAEAVEKARPDIVSFHFGLPDDTLLARVKATGALVFGNATNVDEAQALAARGCDAIIAQGCEAGGHAGYFLAGHQPIGLAALVPAIVDAATVPVIAAGGIADARTVTAAIALGAGAVQTGTAYLQSPEALTGAVHRARLADATADDSVFTTLGARIEGDFVLGNDMVVKANGALGWRHAFADDPISTASFAGGQTFSATGSPIAENALIVEAGVSVDIATNVALDFSYGGQFASDASDHSVSAKFAVKF